MRRVTDMELTALYDSRGERIQHVVKHIYRVVTPLQPKLFSHPNSRPTVCVTGGWVCEKQNPCTHYIHKTDHQYAIVESRPVHAVLGGTLDME